MAGDWIAMRSDLGQDPAVLRVAAALGLDEFGVVGRLHALWAWADAHLADGNADGVSSQWVDRLVSTPGFASALLDAGWLRLRSGGFSLPNFERWNSKPAKQRLLTARRVKAHRGRGSAPGNAASNAASVTDALTTGQESIPSSSKTGVGRSRPPPAGGEKPKPDRPPKPRADPDTPHHLAVAAFCAGWEAKYRAKYPFGGGKDGDAVRAVLKHLGGDVDRFAAVVARYFADADQFVTDARHPLALLRSRLAKYVAAPAAGRPATTGYDFLPTEGP